MKHLIIIAGPTAIGKTALAISLAKAFGTDIISADSRQCFKELNIGVAKPSAKELSEAQHYFINSHSIHDKVDAAVFEKYALQKAAEIFEKKDVAIMVGGTGLYIKAFCEGLDDIPEIPANIRENIQKDYEAKGLEWLQNEVETKDNLYWQQGEQQNPQRLMRALEIMQATGQSIIIFRKKNTVKRAFNIIKIGLELPREILYKRINDRVDIMIKEGLVEEVKSLIPYQKINALQTVGYRELFSYFNNETILEYAINMIKQNTRHYAKRQMTWFKKDVAFKWFSPNDNNILPYLQEAIK